MFGFKKKNEDIKRIDFRDETPEKIDLPMDTESKWDETLPPFDVDKMLGTETRETDTMETKTEEIPEIPKETEELEPVKTEPIQDAVNREELEEISKRIENENKNINRKFKMITKNANQLTLESQELIDLIKLYASMSGKFNEFVEEMHRLEERGWKFDKNIAALYKFRVGMALANMKKQSRNVEKICKKVGFTPSNIKTILDSSIEELVKSLNGKTIEIPKPKR
jgi:hypothetical protein